MRSLTTLVSTLVLLAGLITPRADALVTAYVSFEHPEGWRCELSQGVWICQSTIEPDRKESVVLSIATMATEWDTLENYEEYLKQPRTIQDEEGNSLTSTVTFVRKRNLNGTMWVDSLQFNSELPGFWARYVATVHNKLAILITYIVSEERYKQLAPQFERMVASLKPNAEFDLNIASKQGDGPLPGSSVMGPVRDKLIKDRLALTAKSLKRDDKKTPTEAPGAEGGDSPTTTLVAVGGGAGVIWWILRRRRKAKKSTPSEPKRKSA